jgi:hypothetical protein
LSNFLKVNFITCKLSMIKISWKLMMFQKYLCMFKAFQNPIVNHGIFPVQMSFFVSNVHNSFSNLERIYILTIKIEWIKVNEIHVYNAFYHFWCKHDFGLQNYEIWGCVFKIIHFHITIIMDAKIHYIWSRCNKNLFISNT